MLVMTSNWHRSNLVQVYAHEHGILRGRNRQTTTVRPGIWEHKKKYSWKKMTSTVVSGWNSLWKLRKDMRMSKSWLNTLTYACTWHNWITNICTYKKRTSVIKSMPLLGWNFLCCLFLCFLSGLKVLNLLWLLHKSARHSIVFTRAGQNKLKLDFNIVRSDVTDCLFSGKKIGNS